LILRSAILMNRRRTTAAHNRNSIDSLFCDILFL
jgi:hypothetical protein